MAKIQFAKIKHFDRKMKYLKAVEMAKSRDEINEIDLMHNLKIDNLEIKLLSAPSIFYPNHATFKIGEFDLGEGKNSVTRILNDAVGMTLLDCLVYNDELEKKYDDGEWLNPDWDIVEQKVDALYKKYRTHLAESYTAEIQCMVEEADDAQEAIDLFKCNGKGITDVVGVVPAKSKMGRCFWLIRKNPKTDDFVSEGLKIVLDTVTLAKEVGDYYCIFN